MRDDNHSRNYPPNDPSRRPVAGAGNAPAGDPLAELARLIGQNDPFSDFGRNQAAFNRSGTASSARTAPNDGAHPTYAQTRLASAICKPQPAHAHGAFPPASTDTLIMLAQDLSRKPDRSRRARDYPHDPQPQDYNPQHYGDPRYAGYGDQQDTPQHSFQPAHGQQGSDPYYRRARTTRICTRIIRRARRRGGLLTVMAVLALAVVGTAAAFGYRAVFSNAGAALTPPTIKADAGPNKVVPTSQSGDASGKLIYDRVGDKSQPERVVSREEQPVGHQDARRRRALSCRPACPIRSHRSRSTPVPPSAPAFAAPRRRRRRLPPTPRPNRKESARSRSGPISPRAETASARARCRSGTARSRRGRAGARQHDRAHDHDPPAGRSTGGAKRSERAALADAEAVQRSARAQCARHPHRPRNRSQPRPGSAYAVQVTSQRSEAEAQSSYPGLAGKISERAGQPSGGDPAR